MHPGRLGSFFTRRSTLSMGHKRTLSSRRALERVAERAFYRRRTHQSGPLGELFDHGMLVDVDLGLWANFKHRRGRLQHSVGGPPVRRCHESWARLGHHPDALRLYVMLNHLLELTTDYVPQQRSRSIFKLGTNITRKHSFSASFLVLWRES